jgi:branched-chain amino acid transport system permease protein
MQPFVEQVLRGVRSELGIETNPLTRFLYSGGSLRTVAAVVIGLAGFGLHLVLRRPGRTPLRTQVARLPNRSRRVAGGGALLVAALLIGVLPSILGSFLSEVLSIAGIFALMALGLNIVVGFAGLLDLGYVAFFAVGAYTTAVLTSPTGGAGWIFWAAVPFVVLAAAVAGLTVGTPVLRMRGDYLAIVTLGFGEIARLLFLSDWLAPTFGGAQGIKAIPDITIGPWEIRGPQAFLYPLIVLILLAAYVSHALQNSRIGRAWMAMREDESVAEAVGVNIVAAKLSAFIVGAILAGLGGALFATKIGSIFPNSFDIIVSITVLVVVIVGGMASVPGVILGAVVLVGLPELLREFEDFRFLIYGALLIFMMLRRPEGFIPSRRRAQELHEADIAQDAWLRARAAGARDGG